MTLMSIRAADSNNPSQTPAVPEPLRTPEAQPQQPVYEPYSENPKDAQPAYKPYEGI
jgi:hypothetical protein